MTRALSTVVVVGLAWLCFGWAGLALVALIGSWLFVWALARAADRPMPPMPRGER